MIHDVCFVCRDLARDVLTVLNFHEIPCLVFSAGLGEFLEELLYRDSAFFPNMKIVANYMDFNEAGESVSIKEPLIHVYVNLYKFNLRNKWFMKNNIFWVSDLIKMK